MHYERHFFQGPSSCNSCRPWNSTVIPRRHPKHNTRRVKRLANNKKHGPHTQYRKSCTTYYRMYNFSGSQQSVQNSHWPRPFSGHTPRTCIKHARARGKKKQQQTTKQQKTRTSTTSACFIRYLFIVACNTQSINQDETSPPPPSNITPQPPPQLLSASLPKKLSCLKSIPIYR